MTILITGGDPVPESEFCPDCGWPWQACDCESYDEDAWCPHCQGQGRIPAPDYLAIMGKSYVACEHCEAGLQWLAYC